MLPLLYRGLTQTLTPLVTVYLRRRRRQGKEDALRFQERQGIPSIDRPPGPLVWVHAASVGEATAVLALIERLLEERPTLEILVTTGTVASAALLDKRLPARARHQYVPVDLPRWIGRFLDHWRPDLALWVESELWPNLVLATHVRGIPMVPQGIKNEGTDGLPRHGDFAPALALANAASFNSPAEFAYSGQSRDSSDRGRDSGERFFQHTDDEDDREAAGGGRFGSGCF